MCTCCFLLGLKIFAVELHVRFEAVLVGRVRAVNLRLLAVKVWKVSRKLGFRGGIQAEFQG